jgi:dephospho-CoA kinase
MTSCRRAAQPFASGAVERVPIPVIGLTGTIGSGKSAFASMLARRGAFVIDADRVGHELLEKPEVRDQVAARFGETVLKHQGRAVRAGSRIDRAALGAMVFADEKTRRALEAIVHPRMRARFQAEIERQRRLGEASLIVLDAAILFEAGWHELCDRVVFIDAPLRERLSRVAQERGWSPAALEAREASQFPGEEKRRRADLVLYNGAALDHLSREIDRHNDFFGLSSSQTDERRRSGQSLHVASASDEDRQ